MGVLIGVPGASVYFAAVRLPSDQAQAREASRLARRTLDACRKESGPGPAN